MLCKGVVWPPLQTIHLILIYILLLCVKRLCLALHKTIQYNHIINFPFRFFFFRGFSNDDLDAFQHMLGMRAASPCLPGRFGLCVMVGTSDA